MNISNITPSQVWTSSSRSLTDIGTGALAPANTLSTTLAASASIDLRTSAGIVGNMTIAAITGGTATGAISLAIFDGTQTINLAISAAGANASTTTTGFNCNTSGMNIHNNDAAVAGRYQITQFLWTI